MIEIDCAQFKDAGGQILRTSLGLSALLQKEVRLSNIRAGRPNPGLQPQHLASVKTIASLCNASVQGAQPYSKSISFKPGKISSMQLNVNIGTAGSLTLMLQQLYPLAVAGKVHVRAMGGTHVAFAPTTFFVQEVLLPSLVKMGLDLDVDVLALGYFPKGQGRIVFSSSDSCVSLKPIKITSLGSLHFVKCFSHCSGLPRDVAETQTRSAMQVFNKKFSNPIDWTEQIHATPSRKDTIGSAIDLIAFFDSGAALSGNALGEKGKPAEEVGAHAAEQLLSELNACMPCDSHLADQLIPFMALAKGTSELHVTQITQHILTNIQVTQLFLPEVQFSVEGELGLTGKIKVNGIGFISVH